VEVASPPGVSTLVVKGLGFLLPQKPEALFLPVILIVGPSNKLEYISSAILE
jgi:hypothetical protein